MEATKNPQVYLGGSNRSAFFDTIRRRKRLGSVSASCYLFLFERSRSSSPMMWPRIGQITRPSVATVFSSPYRKAKSRSDPNEKLRMQSAEYRKVSHWR